MTGPNSDEDITMDYDKDQSAEPIKIKSSFNDWDDHFNNQYTTDCPITSCSLYENDCSTSFSGNVAMSATSPWSITMDRTITAGYQYDLCVKCTNGHQT
jgi:hypothetical protein